MIRDNLLYISLINAKALWVVIRDTKTTDPQEYLKEQFQDWEIVNLTYPLRTSKTLSEVVKNDDIYYTLHRNTFNSSLDLPPNMPNGPKPLLLPRFTTIFTPKKHFDPKHNLTQITF